MSVRIATAPDSWGVWFADDLKQTPWHRFLDEAVEAGYEAIELGPYGYLPKDTATLRDELGRRGLKVSGTFIMPHLEDEAAWPDIEALTLGAGASLGALGAEWLVLIDDVYSDLFSGRPMRASRLDNTAWQQLIDTIHRVAEIAQRRFGLKLAFHPHAETHVEYEQQIEQLLAQTDSSLVHLCLDTGHHAYRGGDPVAFLRKHADRVGYLHLKSVDPTIQKRVEAEHIPFAIAVGMDMFCEPAAGTVNFPALVKALQDVGYHGWAVVEQDMYPAPFEKPLPIAKRTREYLRNLGIG